MADIIESALNVVRAVQSREALVDLIGELPENGTAVLITMDDTGGLASTWYHPTKSMTAIVRQGMLAAALHVTQQCWYGPGIEDDDTDGANA